MLRICVVAGFVFISTSAFAKMMDTVKGIKFGVGCASPVTTFAARLGTCAVDGSKFRIWCPNGNIFDRVAERPASLPVIRAICDLNQIL